jgi:hypothetical protein
MALCGAIREDNGSIRWRRGAHHLDLALVGGLLGVCSVFGLPWLVARFGAKNARTNSHANKSKLL